MLSRSLSSWLRFRVGGCSSSVLALVLAAAPLISTAQAQTMRRTPVNCNTCPPGYVPSGTMSNGSGAGSGSMSDPNNPNATNDPNNPNANDPNNQLTNPDQVFNQPANNNFQAASNTSSSAPNTIGDFFGTVPTNTTIISTFGSIQHVDAPGPNGALGGRQKLVEHESPLPRDRVFLNYSYFDNVPLTREGVNVHRYTPGFEKTFFDGMASVTVRVPLLTTLDNDVHTGGSLTDTENQLGNINIGGKLLLASTDTYALSIGTTVTLPTAPDIKLYAEDTDALVARYENQSVHILPYIGIVLTPTDRLFTQVIFQLDFDTKGNSVQIANNIDGALETVGRMQDANFAYLTWSTGYWLMKHQSRRGIEHGIAPIVELHYNRSIKDFDKLSGNTSGGGAYGIGTNPPGGTDATEIDSFEALNITFGLHLQCTYNSTLTLGYATPLAGVNKEDQFNGEFRVLLNYYFGGGGGLLPFSR